MTIGGHGKIELSIDATSTASVIQQGSHGTARHGTARPWHGTAMARTARLGHGTARHGDGTARRSTARPGVATARHGPARDIPVMNNW